jgi:septal ring factor EnvC (AmiA/AmiB activator)
MIWRIALAVAGLAWSVPVLAATDIDSDYGKALQTELGLLKTLDQLDRDVVELEGRLVKLATQRADAADALAKAEERRAKAAAELARMQGAVRARLRAVLKIAHMPTLRFALSSRDFAESVVEDRLLRNLLRADRQRLADYRTRLHGIERLTAGRDAALKQLTVLDLQLHEEHARAERERRDKAALVVKIAEDRKFHERAARDLDTAHRQLTAQIATLHEWQERKYTFALMHGRLMAPIMGRVEVGFGELRHPKFGTTTLHRGLDYRPWSQGPGTAVRAVFWGRVAYVGWLTGYGDTVILDHGRSWHTVYAHLDAIRVQEGAVVASRERIADVGQSGSVKGRYLYFEIRRNGQPVDPAEFFNR